MNPPISEFTAITTEPGAGSNRVTIIAYRESS
jgi:hypothetical protein